MLQVWLSSIIRWLYPSKKESICCYIIAWASAAADTWDNYSGAELYLRPTPNALPPT